MADTDFYNLNLYRSYPLTDYPYRMPAGWQQHWLVDAGFVFAPDSSFNGANADHRVYINSWTVTAGVITLTLQVYAPGTDLHNVLIPVTGATSQEKFTQVDIDYEYDASKAHIAGFIVFGDVSDAVSLVLHDPGYYLTLLPPTSPDGWGLWANTQILAHESEHMLSGFERRCVQALTGHYVTRVLAANQPRTSLYPGDVVYSPLPPTGETVGMGLWLATQTFSVSPPGPGYVTLATYTTSAAPAGLWFKEGYNCRITTARADNALRFSAARGAGAGEACEDRPRTETERLLLESIQADPGWSGQPYRALDLSVRCSQVITNICGVSPNESGKFTLANGHGIQITADGQHKLRISAATSLSDCNT